MPTPRATFIFICSLEALQPSIAQDFCWYDDYGRNGQCLFFLPDECQVMVETEQEGYCKPKPETDISVLGSNVWAAIPSYNIDEDWEQDQILLTDRSALFEIVYNEMLRENFSEAEAEMRAYGDLEGIAMIRRYAAAPSPDELKQKMTSLGIPIWRDKQAK